MENQIDIKLTWKRPSPAVRHESCVLQEMIRLDSTVKNSIWAPYQPSAIFKIFTHYMEEDIKLGITVTRVLVIYLQNDNINGTSCNSWHAEGPIYVQANQVSGAACLLLVHIRPCLFQPEETSFFVVAWESLRSCYCIFLLNLDE